MNSRYKRWVTSCLGLGMICFLSLFDFRQSVSAQGSECLDRSLCGEVSPFIPMQSAEAVHMGLVWKKGSQKPKILFHARFPEYSGNDMADPAITDLAIARGALTTAGHQFHAR